MKYKCFFMESVKIILNSMSTGKIYSFFSIEKTRVAYYVCIPSFTHLGIALLISFSGESDVAAFASITFMCSNW